MNDENTSTALEPVIIKPKKEFSRARLLDLLGDRAYCFIKRHGILIVIGLILTLWTWTVTTIAAHNARVDTRAELEAEYKAKIAAFYEAQAAEWEASQTAAQEADAQMEREAEALARLIGPLKTKRMRGTMIWNVLARVDNPSYPSSVEEVIEQPKQWIFYSESNAWTEENKQLALEQLTLWHSGQYPSGLDSSFVFGEWSENDYALRNTWDKTSRTLYWRMPE